MGLRYLNIFINRIGSIVTYYAPYIGLIMLMNHYHAELIPLDAYDWSSFNNTLYEYWNPITNETQSINITELFRSNYTDTDYPQPPPITLYTLTDLRTAYGLFWVIYLFYAILVFLVKYLFNGDFKKASKWEKLQHITETLNNPEAFGDWDTDRNLDLDGHLQKWWNILFEMWVMGFLQLLTNFCLLIPFFVTGMKLLDSISLLTSCACNSYKWKQFDTSIFKKSHSSISEYSEISLWRPVSILKCVFPKCLKTLIQNIQIKSKQMVSSWIVYDDTTDPWQ